MSDTEDLLSLFSPTPGVSPWRLGTVTSLFTTTMPTIRFDGEVTASTKRYPVLSSYTAPAVNDRVLLARVSGTYVVLGKVRTA